MCIIRIPPLCITITTAYLELFPVKPFYTPPLHSKGRSTCLALVIPPYHEQYLAIWIEQL